MIVIYLIISKYVQITTTLYSVLTAGWNFDRYSRCYTDPSGSDPIRRFRGLPSPVSYNPRPLDYYSTIYILSLRGYRCTTGTARPGPSFQSRHYFLRMDFASVGHQYCASKCCCCWYWGCWCCCCRSRAN